MPTPRSRPSTRRKPLTEIAAASDQIAASGIGFDEAFQRLRQGRTYARDVQRGVVQGSYRSEAGEYFYSLDVPETYDPARKYQVRVQLHGGVGRIDDNRPRESGPQGRLAGAEQIYVLPYAWKDAPWWTGRQADNLRAILDRVKRTYNVDENRVVLSGVSDGGTGVYYMAHAEHDAVCELPAAQRFHHGPQQREARTPTAISSRTIS